MFTIKKSQMDVFDAKAYDKFVERMVQYIKDTFGGVVTETDDELIDLVVDLIDDAEEYDIIAEDDVQNYIELCYNSELLQKEPKIFWIENVLCQPNINGAQKIEVLRSRLFPDKRDEK